jgi:outer membrane PBP1 activator LpoA protein
LALNTLPDQITRPANLFQFVLDPAEEARQVAQRIAATGLTRGVALLPKSDWGERVGRALDTELKSQGGSLVGQTFYDRKGRDFTDPVTSVLLINESIARAKALSAALGSKLEFEARPRADLQFVFLGAEPAQGRLIRPTIRFHVADQVPIFATSDIYEPDATANSDLEGVNFPDMPWLISPDEGAVQLRAALNRYWPGRARERGRLYALGFDTYRLIPLLLSQGTNAATNEASGVTGRLSIDNNGNVKHQLNWARIVNGRAQAQDSNPIRAQPASASAGSTH